jgi:hypothetical protein
MARELVDSEAIASVEYWPDAQILEVEFITGRIYHYYDVPRTVADEMHVAESLGGWFNSVFKPAGFRYAEVPHHGLRPDEQRGEGRPAL